MTDSIKGRGASRSAFALCLATLGLVFCAGPASAARLTPISHDFGPQIISTSSAAKGFTLTAGCNFELLGNCVAPESFSPSISVGTAEFSQLNNCPSTLVGSVAGTSCTINVIFTPKALGPRQDTLRAGTNGPTAPLTGEGVLAETTKKKKCQKQGKKGAASAKKRKCKKKKGKKKLPVIEFL